jgi:hypothetical protein
MAGLRALERVARKEYIDVLIIHVVTQPESVPLHKRDIVGKQRLSA